MCGFDAQGLSLMDGCGSYGGLRLLAFSVWGFGAITLQVTNTTSYYGYYYHYYE